MTKKKTGAGKVKLKKKSLRKIDNGGLEEARGGTDTGGCWFSQACNDDGPGDGATDVMCGGGGNKPTHWNQNHNQQLRARLVAGGRGR